MDLVDGVRSGKKMWLFLYGDVQGSKWKLKANKEGNERAVLRNITKRVAKNDGAK